MSQPVQGKTQGLFPVSREAKSSRYLVTVNGFKKAYLGNYPEFFRDFITQNLLQGSNELAKFIILSKPGLSKFMDYGNLCWYYSVFLWYLAGYPAFWLSGLMVSQFIHPGQQ